MFLYKINGFLSIRDLRDVLTKPLHLRTGFLAVFSLLWLTAVWLCHSWLNQTQSLYKPSSNISEYLSEHGTQPIPLHIEQSRHLRPSAPSGAPRTQIQQPHPPRPTNHTDRPKMPPRTLFRRPLALRIVSQPTYIHGALLKCYSARSGASMDVLPHSAAAGVTKPEIQSPAAEVGERSNRLCVNGHAEADSANSSPRGGRVCPRYWGTPSRSVPTPP